MSREQLDSPSVQEQQFPWYDPASAPIWDEFLDPTHISCDGCGFLDTAEAFPQNTEGAGFCCPGCGNNFSFDTRPYDFPWPSETFPAEIPPPYAPPIIGLLTDLPEAPQQHQGKGSRRTPARPEDVIEGILLG